MLPLLQIRSIFNKKFILILLSVLLFITLLQALRLRQYFLVYELDGTILDFLFFTLGARENPTLFTFILTWTVLSIFFLYVSFLSKKVIEDFAELLLSRVKTRIKLWFSICITQFILSVILFLAYGTIVIFIGRYFFGMDLSPSEYTVVFYSDWLDINPFLFVKMCLVFISGLHALFMIGQFILLVFENKAKSIMVFILMMMTGSILYVYTSVHRIFALSLYVSMISLGKDGILLGILVNLGIVISLVLFGCLQIRKKDL